MHQGKLNRGHPSSYSYVSDASTFNMAGVMSKVPYEVAYISLLLISGILLLKYDWLWGEVFYLFIGVHLGIYCCGVP